MPKLKKKDVLTTGQVAKVLRVAPRTVSTMIDDGRLKGWKIPGTKDRRVDYHDLYAFCVQNSIPTHLLDDIEVPPTAQTKKVWFIGQDMLYMKVIDQILQILGSKIETKILPAEGVTFQMGQEKPDLVIINYDIEGRERVMSIVKAVGERCRFLVMHSENMSQTTEALLNKLGVTILRY